MRVDIEGSELHGGGGGRGGGGGGVGKLSFLGLVFCF